ncbi:C1 family peptidase [Sphingomonas morindae]|uniref:Peptidase C1A papain C-terminal domain-containing protein n=1 Tax=Sphingomonas morindae TaxID=1541170 RepID=A0ABY4XDP1_9SPHN|nr:C1 family peptidase [Sphingomonas morindae]USI74969.1 hypothetical protein LHA26_17530 [Sphingomonas morindae]
MAELDIHEVQQAVAEARAKWRVQAPPAGAARHPLGWNPAPGALVQAALQRTALLVRAPVAPGSAEGLGSSQAPLLGGPPRPPSFDWRSRKVIGPVTDQRWCGSCVSFATVGLVSAMAAIELGVQPPDLSEADQHFCSSHGAGCGGWNNHDALDQIRQRGVVGEADFPYMSAFDTPPVTTDPNDPNALWVAHCRGVADRPGKIWKITAFAAFSGDARKDYLAKVGPLVCGFQVYEDFDSYGGGLYTHVTGALRGGHAVLVIGYDDNAGCWICRNSWGSGFGGPADPDGTGAGFFRIGYGQCGIDNEPMYGATGVIPPSPSGWRGWWPVGNGQAAPNGAVFGVSRGPDQLDIFVPGAHGETNTAAWQPDFTSWHGWWQVQGGVAAPGSAVTAVSRSRDKLDIFTLGTDHRIYTAAWEPGFTGWHGWWPVLDLRGAPGSSVFGVSRSADKLDIFAVGADQGIYSAAWEPGFAGWHGWWRIQGGAAAPNSSVTAVSRSADKLDIFAVGTDHKVYTAAWEPGLGWRGWWPVLGGVAAPGSSVFATVRAPDHLDIFCVGTDRGVYTAAWEPGFTAWHGWWRIGTLRAMPGTSVHAVSRGLNKLDIFAVGEDGTICTAAWEPGLGWRGWWPILNGRSAPGSMVSAVVRAPDHLDVFAVGTDHKVWTAAWQP